MTPINELTNHIGIGLEHQDDHINRWHLMKQYATGSNPGINEHNCLLTCGRCVRFDPLMQLPLSCNLRRKSFTRSTTRLPVLYMSVRLRPPIPSETFCRPTLSMTSAVGILRNATSALGSARKSSVLTSCPCCPRGEAGQLGGSERPRHFTIRALSHETAASPPPRDQQTVSNKTCISKAASETDRRDAPCGPATRPLSGCVWVACCIFPRVVFAKNSVWGYFRAVSTKNSALASPSNCMCV